MAIPELRAGYPHNYWKVLVGTFCLGWAVLWVYRALLAPIYTEIQMTIGPQSNAALGLIASCYFFGYTALQIPAGLLVDRYGQKKILLPSFTLFALGVALTGLAHSIFTIYVGSFLAGVGCGSYYASAYSLTSQHVPPAKKGMQTAIVNSGSALGLILGMLGSSYLVKTWHWPWQSLIFLSALLIVGAIFWFAHAIIDPSQVAVPPQTEGAAAEDDEGYGFSLFSLPLVTCYFLYFTTCYAYYLLITWLPQFLELERNITGGMIGLMVSLISVTAVPGALFFAHLSDKHARAKAVLILVLELASFALVAVSMFVQATWALALVLLLYGFLGKMAVDPVLISYVSDLADKDKLGTTLGLFNFFGMASSVVAPTLTGFIMDSTGSGAWGFYLGAVLLLLGALVFYGAQKRLGQGEKP